MVRNLYSQTESPGARSHLTMAGLLEKTGKGRFRITERGKEAMGFESCQGSIMRFLLQFPEYAEARSRSRKLMTLIGAGGTCVRN